jgi:hypothetical protein
VVNLDGAARGEYALARWREQWRAQDFYFGIQNVKGVKKKNLTT